MSRRKIYCEPDNFVDLSQYSNPVIYKFNQTGVDVGTLNLIGWLLQGLPYKKIRTLITCGVDYKYQVEYGPYAAFNKCDGFLRNAINQMRKNPCYRDVKDDYYRDNLIKYIFI